MSENVAQIEIQTIDNTGKGLSSVSTRFDNFGKQLENLEKNLKPVKQILDSGIAIGGSMSGMASLAKNSGNVSAAMEDLKTNLLQIGGAASEAGEKLSGFDGALQNIAKAGAIATQFFTAVRGSVEFGKKLVAGYEALKVVYAEMQAVQTAATASAAKEITAKTTDIIVTETSTISQANNNRQKIVSASLWSTLTRNIMANAAAQKVWTVTSTITSNVLSGLNKLKVLSISLLNSTTIGTYALAAAQKVWAAVTTMASGAVTLLNVAMAANPIMFWITAIAALAAGIGIAISKIRSFTKESETAAEKAMKAAEAIERLQGSRDASRDESGRKAERLTMLASKEGRTSQEEEEMAELISDLNDEYADLNLTMEDAENGFRRLHDEMDEQIVRESTHQIEQLWKAWREGINGGASKEETDKIFQQIQDTEKRQMEAKNRITQRELEDQQKVKEAELANQEKVKEAELANQKKIQQEKEKNQDLVKDLQEEISNEGKSQLQRELDAVQKKIDARDQEMKKLLQEGQISQKQYDQEMQQIKNVGEARKKQIEERYEKEAKEKEKAETAEKAKAKAEEAKRNRDEIQGYADSMKAAFVKTDQERREEKEDDDFASLMETNPLKAFQFAREKTAQSVNLEQNAKKDWQKMFQEAKKDGVIDEAEKKQLEKAQTRYEEALRQRERSESKLKSAQGAIDQNVQDILGKQGAPSGPVDALMKGSMEAFQKETELRNQEKPAEKNIQNIVDILREHFRISENFAVQNRETSDQIRNGLVGV